MVNQQIINWIKQQDSQGYSSQQLYNYLIQQGYNPNEVNEAIRIVSQPTSQVNQLSIIIIGIVVVTLMCGGMIFLFSQNDGAVSDTEINSETDLSGCDVFPNRLESCEPFSCKFEHPFTGEMVEKKIIGLVDGKCQYTEEMPNNGRMDCEYSENLRKAIAQYHRDIAAAESAGTSVTADLRTGGVETTYTIDGKEVENPLQEAMTNGQCVISGYEKLQVDDKKIMP